MVDVPINRSTKLLQRLSSFRRIYTKSSWMQLFLSPLSAGLLLTLVIRIWLVVYTHGVVSGDEALVGIQAEHILRGEYPIYYYNQAYMGSFEAYIMAFIFLFTGPSGQAFRVEPILICLILVYLTWRFACALADGARLSTSAKALFVTIATLSAAFPPLYDIVEEMRGTGGYIEVFTVMLWLLYCTWSLTDRWRKHASRRELLMRWAGLGFLVGFGLWINPLVAYALVTIALWLGWFLLEECIRPRHQNAGQPRLTLLKEARLAIVAIPAGCLGFAPGLYWGALHQWQNITYMFNNAGSKQDRFHTIMQVQSLYISCLAPRAIGGTVPTQPYVTTENPHIMTLGVIIGAGCFFLCALACILSCVWPQTILKNIRQLTILPVLFFCCVSVIFCIASISGVAVQAGCGPRDYAGRYVVPLVLALPFFVAAVFTLPLLRKKRLPDGQEEERREPRKSISGSRVVVLWTALQIVLLFVLATNFLVLTIEYKQADPGYTFQEAYPASAYPVNNDPLIAYMQQANIHYAWGNGWIADPITFKTNGSIIVTEPHGRIDVDSQAVLHAKRTALLLIVLHSDAHPFILGVLDAKHVSYKVGRFYSEPGIDTLVIIPQNRTISPLDPAFAAMFSAIFNDPL